MTRKGRLKQFQPLLWATALALLILGVPAGFRGVSADDNFFLPGNLVVSRSIYDNNPNNVQVGMTLPPNCVMGNGCAQAVVDGTYPYVWNNDTVDGSFGITSKIFLDQITTKGSFINSLEVPNSSQNGVPPTKDQMVTSFLS